MNRLFVYGTLGPGRPNEHVMLEIGGYWEEATVKGKLENAGWGAQMGYPGIILDESGEDIAGFLFCSDNLSHHWDQLDEFEGLEYQRVRVQATKKDGAIVDAFIYQLR